MMLIAPEEVDGRIVLVGITWVQPDGSYSQEQHCGVAEIVSQPDGIGIVQLACDDGRVREYPFDARSLEPAAPGQYRLRSTGQVVVNPDFLMTWTLEKRLNS